MACADSFLAHLVLWLGILRYNLKLCIEIQDGTIFCFGSLYSKPLRVEKNILMMLGINSGPLAAIGIHQLLSGSPSPDIACSILIVIVKTSTD